MTPNRILYKDENILALNKPYNLPVQGGSKTQGHLELLLDQFRFEKSESPRLVHRLDKGTCGVLLLARNKETAVELGKIFENPEGKIVKTVGLYLLFCQVHVQKAKTQNSIELCSFPLLLPTNQNSVQHRESQLVFFL